MSATHTDTSRRARLIAQLSALDALDAWERTHTRTQKARRGSEPPDVGDGDVTLARHATVRHTQYGVEVTFDFRLAQVAISLRELERFVRHPMHDMGRWDGEYVRWERVRGVWRSGPAYAANEREKMELVDTLTPVAAFAAERIASDGCVVDAAEACEHGKWALLCSREPYVAAPCGRNVRLSQRDKHERRCPNCRYEAMGRTRKLTGGWIQQ